MSDLTRVEIGDWVIVIFDQWNIPRARVESEAQATGDVWRLIDETNTVWLVQNFNAMRLLEKGEK